MIALDSNVLVYAEAVGDDARLDQARTVVAFALRTRLILPAQALAELYRVLVRKVRVPADEARARVARYERAATVAPTLPSTLSAALELAVGHQFQIFDAIILAASAEVGCRMLLSEDVHEGFVWRGVTIVNPFSAKRHPLLADALRTDRR